jgi:hypothetical protein
VGVPGDLRGGTLTTTDLHEDHEDGTKSTTDSSFFLNAEIAELAKVNSDAARDEPSGLAIAEVPVA